MAQPIWQTLAGSIGTFPALIPIGSGDPKQFVFIATAVPPATSVNYLFLSGSLPPDLTFDDGILSGTPVAVSEDTTYTFTLRAIDNLGNIRDRTFSLTISGNTIPEFITPEGEILSILDSVWVEYPILFTNPGSSPYFVELKEGTLPDGLEINVSGIIRGYATPPTINTELSQVEATITNTSSSSNILTCLSTSNFTEGRPIIFLGVVFGGLVSGTTYYIKEVIDSTKFTIASTQNGPTIQLENGTGVMIAILPSTTQGYPTKRTYTFSLKLNTLTGTDLSQYSITVTNQNLPVSSGGPGFLNNTRIPTILNTRPLSFNVYRNDPENYSYYIVPPMDSNQTTILPSNLANIGQISNQNFFSFRILGYDFDNNSLNYSFFNLPPFLQGDTQTGWITGTPNFSVPNLTQYDFSVEVFKTNNTSIKSATFNFSLILSTDIMGNIIWITPENLGNLNNGEVSRLAIKAESDVNLQYQLVSGNLPPNLTLAENGDILGTIAFQPETGNTPLPTGSTTEFSFIVQAYSPEYSLVTSNKQFTMDVIQRIADPADVLYMKATPSIKDREIINSLLNDPLIIPDEFLYRPDDPNFGKANSIIYEHAYGILASQLDQYIEAIQLNHYNRFITLGEINTAIAKNNSGEVVYEVVYSEIIDNLINPSGVSIPERIVWPRSIPVIIDGIPQNIRSLYPNSLINMRDRVGQILGRENDSALLPLWMVSQQENGSTLGYIQAWVICYTKPGFSKTIVNNINNNWRDPVGKNYRLNQINFQIDRFSVDKSMTYNINRTNIEPPIWEYEELPSATPQPDPIDSEDFYVVFPRKTILPGDPE
jgi:hypothetical protein